MPCHCASTLGSSKHHKTPELPCLLSTQCTSGILQHNALRRSAVHACMYKSKRRAVAWDRLLGVEHGSTGRVLHVGIEPAICGRTEDRTCGGVRQAAWRREGPGVPPSCMHAFIPDFKERCTCGSAQKRASSSVSVACVHGEGTHRACRGCVDRQLP